jgi:hypothetical protein
LFQRTHDAETNKRRISIHHLLLDICGSRRFHTGSGLIRLHYAILLLRPGSSPFTVLG